MYTEISDKIYHIGFDDRTTDLFEALWPIPEGISYNAYLITDEVNILIDTVGEEYHDRFIEQVEKILAGKKIDYLIINHIEPDHSGSLKDIAEKYPDMKIIGNKRTIDMVNNFYGITKNVQEIIDLQEMKTGQYNLRFYLTPMLHWPETMMCYETKTKTMFSGDVFGCYGALNGGVIDESINTDIYKSEMRRYYATIISKYAMQVQNAIQKLESVEINTICSTHGPVWRSKAFEVISDYNNFGKSICQKGVTIVYGSMYGHTREMAETIAKKISHAGVKDIQMFDISRTHVSYVLSSIIKYNTVIIGTATYNGSLMPNIAAVLDSIKNRKITDRKFGSFGNFSWASQIPKEFDAFLEVVGWDKLSDTVMQKSNVIDDNVINNIKALCQAVVEQTDFND